MHVVEPSRYQTRPKHRRRWPYAAVPVALVVVLGAANYLRPLPAATATIRVNAPAAKTPHISWPVGGQAAIAAKQYGLLDTSGSQAPLATASIAKVITALCVLQKDPLAPGQSGPTFTVTANDVSIYDNYVAEDGSLVPVKQGEQMTEYQALEALMIPSANNIADALAGWAFGGQTAYATYAGEFLQQHGIDNTHIGSDASGYNPSTTSTASDLTQLGLLAFKNPVLMAIASQSSTTLPIAGKVTNYDTVLGQNGITGLKTGNNAIDMGAFLFTASAHVGGTSIPVTGAVMGAPNLSTALQESVRLAGSLEQGFKQVTIVRTGQAVGTTRTAWGAISPIQTAGTAQLVRWEATPITLNYQIDAKLRSGTIGTLRATAGPASARTSLKLTRPLAGPGFWWRLIRH